MAHGGQVLPRWWPRSRRWWVAAATAAVLLVLSGQVGDSASGDTAARCDRHERAAAARAALDAGPSDGRRVTVIGDSYSVGLGLESPTDSWPSRLTSPLSARVHVDGFSGSGFSARASGCGAVSFADRAAGAARGADLVVVEGGLNDVDQSDEQIRAGFARLMDSLVGHDVVVVGPALAPARAGRVPHVDALLAGLAEQHGAAYVGTSDLALTYLADRLHLTATGHRAFGDAVATAILELP